MCVYVCVCVCVCVCMCLLVWSLPVALALGPCQLSRAACPSVCSPSCSSAQSACPPHMPTRKQFSDTSHVEQAEWSRRQNSPVRTLYSSKRMLLYVLPLYATERYCRCMHRILQWILHGRPYLVVLSVRVLCTVLLLALLFLLLGNLHKNKPGYKTSRPIKAPHATAASCVHVTVYGTAYLVRLALSALLQQILTQLVLRCRVTILHQPPTHSENEQCAARFLRRAQARDHTPRRHQRPAPYPCASCP